MLLKYLHALVAPIFKDAKARSWCFDVSTTCFEPSTDESDGYIEVAFLANSKPQFKVRSDHLLRLLKVKQIEAKGFGEHRLEYIEGPHGRWYDGTLKLYINRTIRNIQ